MSFVPDRQPRAQSALHDRVRYQGGRRCGRLPSLRRRGAGGIGFRAAPLQFPNRYPNRDRRTPESAELRRGTTAGASAKHVRSRRLSQPDDRGRVSSRIRARAERSDRPVHRRAADGARSRPRRPVSSPRRSAWSPTKAKSDLRGVFRLRNPSRFGVQMPRIDPGSPGNSYLMYKLLRSPKNFELTGNSDVCVTAHRVPLPDGQCLPPSEAESARLREWFVRGQPMPLKQDLPYTGTSWSTSSAGSPPARTARRRVRSTKRAKRARAQAKPSSVGGSRGFAPEGGLREDYGGGWAGGRKVAER